MIIIDYRDHRPIYEQIVERFKELIYKGALEPDSQLPSVRNLAMDLSINPNTIQRAYSELERQSYIYSIKGKGSFVAINDRMLQERRNDIFINLDKYIQEAKNIGIIREHIISIVNENFREEKDHD